MRNLGRRDFDGRTGRRRPEAERRFDDGVGMAKGNGATSASGLGSEVALDPAHHGTRVTIAFPI
jgi:hypothetical protein